MDSDTVDTILEAVREPMVLEGVDQEHRFALVPENMKAIDLKPFLGPPTRIKQMVEALSVPAFCDYLKRYGTETTVIFANEPLASYDAVLDYHPAKLSETSASSRGNCEHILRYQCPQSDQWKIWNASNGKMIGQEEFATFIETNLRDITQPAGADMLQVCLNIQAHKSAKFESGLRLDNGQVQFRYVEEIRGTSNTKAGDIEIPIDLVLDLPVFIDGAAFNQPARFKYRVTEGRLSMGYDLIRPLETLIAAVKLVTTDIKKLAPNVPLYQGARR